jgi:hypothetical protein
MSDNDDNDEGDIFDKNDSMHSSGIDEDDAKKNV